MFSPSRPWITPEIFCFSPLGIARVGFSTANAAAPNTKAHPITAAKWRTVLLLIFMV
jgi:hypothetical protein